METKVKKIRKGKLKERKNKIIAIILSIIILFLVINLISSLSILEKRQIYASIIVSDHYGFDLNGTALTFGMTMPGGSSHRDLIIKNEYNKDVYVESYVKGEIRDFISISDNNFVLKPNETKELSFVVLIPKGTEYGNYTGFVIINFKNQKLF